LVELERNLAALKAKGYGVAAISYDSPAILVDFARRRSITFPLLSDPGSKIIRAFGILNEAAPRNSFVYGVPYPGSFLVDREGKVVAKYFEEDYTERFTASDILVKDLGMTPDGSGTAHETRHLRITSSASSLRVVPGQRIALVLDVELKPKMHVYALGTKGYIPVDWKLSDTNMFVEQPFEYPKSRLLHLKAIKETVPVYEGRFRLVREITIGKKAGPYLPLAGEFRYQACDDKKCYLPVTVPLKWELTVDPLDRERPPAAIQHRTQPR
jgi:hypothetical protein